MRKLLLLLLIAPSVWASRPVINSFTANSTANVVAVASGSVTLAWNATVASSGSTTCSLDSGTGTSFAAQSSCNTSVSVNPSTTTTYTLLASNSTGNAADQDVPGATVTIVRGTNTLSATPTFPATCQVRGVCVVEVQSNISCSNCEEEVKLWGSLTAPSTSVMNIGGWYYGGLINAYHVTSGYAGTGYTAGDVVHAASRNTLDNTFTVSSVSSGVITGLSMSTAGTVGGFHTTGACGDPCGTYTLMSTTGSGTGGQITVTAVSSQKWQLRFSPTELGTYSGTVTLAGIGGSNYYSASFSFTSLPSNNPGFMRVYNTSTAPYTFKTDDGKAYWPVGIQIQGGTLQAEVGTIETFFPLAGREFGPLATQTTITPTSGSIYPATGEFFLSTYAQAGFNFIRGPGNVGSADLLNGSFGILQGYSSGKWQYTGAAVAAMDLNVTQARQYGYHYEMGGFQATFAGLTGYDVTILANVRQMYQSQQYMINCCSALVDVWLLENEKNTDSGSPLSRAYYNARGGYFHQHDIYNHPVTTSFPPSTDGTSAGFYSHPEIDLTDQHDYASEAGGGPLAPTLLFPSTEPTNLYNPIRTLVPNKPLFFDECGNASPFGDDDPYYRERYRIMLWTTWANRVVCVFFPSSGSLSSGALTGLTVTAGNPTTFTKTNHNVTTGMGLWSWDNTGNWANINGACVATMVDADHFTCPFNSTGDTGVGASGKVLTPGGGANDNITIAAIQRQYTKVMAGFMGYADPLATPLSATLSITAPSSQTGSATCLSTSTYVGCYVFHANNHTSAVTASTVTLTVPANSMRAYWISPLTGAVLSSTAVNSGSQALTAPAWPVNLVGGSTDLALMILPAATGIASLTVTDTTGSQQLGRVVTAHRLFASGDIANFPKPVGNKVGVNWQADVHSRWRDGSQTCSVTGATNATPIVITLANCTGDALQPLDQVTLSGVGGNTGANGTFYIESSGASGTYKLLNSAGTGAYTSGGALSGPSAGSAKSVSISWLQSIAASATESIAFVSSTNQCSMGGPLACQAASVNSVLAMRFPDWMYTSGTGWGADMELTNGSTVTANAQTMLTTLTVTPGQISYWLRGPLVTEVNLEDRTTARSYDMAVPGSADCGAQSPCKSLHPRFTLTYINGLDGVQVESIAENVWASKLQPLNYSLNLKTGSPLSSRYTKAAFTHNPASRWHKTYWSGASPGNINIDLNMAYLVSSLALPNYDVGGSFYTIGISAGEINNIMNGIPLTNQHAAPAWNTSDQGDIMGSGQYNYAFGTTGWRAEIGWMEEWNTDFLFSMSNTSNYNTLYPVMAGNADVSSHIPFHVVEDTTASGGQACASTKCFDQLGTVDAFGHPVSTSARSTVSSIWGNSNPATGSDVVTPVVAYPCRSGASGIWWGCSGANTTSASSLAIGTGSKTFVLSSWVFQVGDTIEAYSRADANNKMFGAVTGQAGTSLTVNVTSTGGSGTHADWDIYISSGWSVDMAHQSEFAYIPYLITGKKYFLDELYAWTALDTANGFSSCSVYGHCGAFGIANEISVQMRGHDWAMRNISNTCFAGADADPEKLYACEKLQYNAAAREGQYNVTTGSYNSSLSYSPWQKGFSVYGFGTGYADSNPLFFPINQADTAGDSCNPNTNLSENDAATTCRADSAFMILMGELVWGHVAEVFPTAVKVADQFSKWHIGNVLDSNANPYTIAAYAYPYTRQSDGHYFQTWGAQKLGFGSTFLTNYATGRYPTEDAGYDAKDPEGAYNAILGAASAIAYSRTASAGSGVSAWTWWSGTLSSSQVTGLKANMQQDPKWAIVPRSFTPPAPGSGTSISGSVSISGKATIK